MAVSVLRISEHISKIKDTKIKTELKKRLDYWAVKKVELDWLEIKRSREQWLGGLTKPEMEKLKKVNGELEKLEDYIVRQDFSEITTEKQV